MGNSGSKGRDLPESVTAGLNPAKADAQSDDDLKFEIPDSVLEKFTMDQVQILVKAIYRLPMVTQPPDDVMGSMISSTEVYTVRQSENAKRVLERGDMRTRGLFIMLSGKAKMYVMTEQERNLTDPDVLSRAQHRMRHLPAPPAPREMFTEVLTTGDFFGEVPLVFGVPSTFAVDVQPGSQFVCLLKEAFTDRFMPRIDSPDGEMQMRLWSAHRAYMDLPGNIYFKHSLSREFTKSLPINPKFSSLCNVPSFTGLPYRLLLALSQEKEVTICQPGKTMFRKGLPSTDLHILLTGCVQLEDRHGKVLAEFSANCSKPGIALGEHAFWRSLENAVTCRAMSTCQFVFYSKGHLLKVLRSMKGEDAEYGKAHFKSLVESWDVLHRNIPDDIRQQYPLGYNQDILEYRLLQIPAFSKLRKADLYKLSLSMVVRKFTKQQNIVQDDSGESRLHRCCQMTYCLPV
eukprot:scpid65303/ scgid3033/ 